MCLTSTKTIRLIRDGGGGGRGYGGWGLKVEVLLYVHRNRRLFRDGSPGRPPRLYTAPELWSMGVSKQINMVTIRLIRDGEKGGQREIIYLSLHCHHQNDSCIKMGSNESHFNVSLIVRDKITRQCPQTTTFLMREPKRNRAEALLLTGLTPYR